jgi:hypothetical protein
VAECPEGAPLAAESPEEAESPEAPVAEALAAEVSGAVAGAAAVGRAAAAPPVAELVADWAAVAPRVAEAAAGWAAAEPVDLRAAQPVARPVEGSEAPPREGRAASAEEQTPVPQVKAGRPGPPTVASTRAPTSSNART